MKMRFAACMLVLALLLCDVAAYAKVTTTPNGYTIDFTYDKYRASSSSMYGVYCEAEASLSPAKAGWYIRAALVGPLGNSVVDTGRRYVTGVSSYKTASTPVSNAHFYDVHARGYWGGIY